MLSEGFPDDEDHKERAGSRSGGSHAGWSSRGYIPHYDAAGEYQHIVFRLNDALPKEVMGRLRATPPQGRLKAAEAILDQGAGSGVLCDHRVASIVAETMLKFDQERYRLLAWCIMPNHVHVLLEQRDG